MERDRQNILLFWTSFLPFYPPLPLTTTQKLKILKKWKKTTTTTTKKKRLDISLFYTIVPKIMIIYHTVPEIWHGTDVIFIFHFGLFLPFYTPTSPPQPEQPEKSKLKKKPLESSSFYTCVPKILIT